MNSRRILLPLLAVLLAAGWLAQPVSAQVGQDPRSMNAEAARLMKESKWAEALEVLSACTGTYDGNAWTLYGPVFGVTWYRKGFCELKLRQWTEAMGSFQVCYEKYPNDTERGAGNPYNKRALLYWGQAAQGAEDYAKAIELYQKFLKERDPSRDNFQEGMYYINLSICHYRIGKIAEGTQLFEKALKNRIPYETPESGIIGAFQALVRAVIEKDDQKPLLDFLNANRAELTIEPYAMQGYSVLFLSLAAQAWEAGMPDASIALYQLIPSSLVQLEDIESRLAALAGRTGIKDGIRVIKKSDLEASRDAVEKAIRSGDPHEVTKLRATAYIHQSRGNYRGSFASYEQLETYYPKSKHRELNLYYLVEAATQIGEVLETEKYGSRFLKAFPDSDKVPAVRRMLLTSIFYGGEYAKCIEIGEVMLPKLEEGTAAHDICLHVLGGSYYYTGQFEKAQPLLDQHVELYPGDKTQFEQAALYFQASNNSKLQFWSKAARQLDAFFEKYPEADGNIYYPFALYDRANCHYAENEHDAALQRLARIESEFPNADNMEMVLNLKGNVLQATGQKEEAEAAYLAALELAEFKGSDVIASEALYYLVSLLGEKPKSKDAPNRLADAVPHADHFWKDYPESPYKAQVAVAQVHALSAAGRGDEALNRLRDVIADMATTPGAVGLEEAINSYTEVYLEGHSAEELKEHYYSFPKIQASNKPANALLRIALIGVFEDELEDARANQDRTAIARAEANIKVLFQDLKNDFDTADLSNFILVRVGDFIRETNSPRQALPYYTAALERNDDSYLFPALFGRGAILAGGSPAERQDAIKDFKRVLNDSQDRGDKERALYQMAATHLAAGSHDEAIRDARLYIFKASGDEKPDEGGYGFTARKGEVTMMLAEAYEKAGKPNDAIAAYSTAATNNQGALRISVPAMQKYMELLWQRNNPAGETVSDRQGAYNAGRAFTDLTSRILDKASPEERKAWEELQALVQQYEAHADVKSKEQLEKEAAR